MGVVCSWTRAVTVAESKAVVAAAAAAGTVVAVAVVMGTAGLRAASGVITCQGR